MPEGLVLLDKQYLEDEGLLGAVQNGEIQREDVQKASLIGACADGATELILALDLNFQNTWTESPNWVRLTVLSPDGKDNGYLVGEGQDNNEDGYDDTPRIADGVFTQTWCAPQVFDSDLGSSNTAKTRDITILTEIDPDNDSVYEYSDTKTIFLARSPVVMVHGLWSTPKAFKDLNEVLGDSGWSEGFLSRVNYDNSASFSKNAWAVPRYILNTLHEVRSSDFASAKVDVIAHSMGGLLAKRLDQGFSQENVRKIITIGTPYEGSPWADRVWQVRDTFLGNIIEKLVCAIMPVIPPAIKGGAIEDLRTDPCNVALPVSTQVPGLDCKTVIVGKGLYAGLPAWYRYLLCLLTGQWTAEIVHTEIFGPYTESDWIVSTTSQKYNAPNPCEIAVLWHCSEPSDPDFMDLVVESLNQPAEPGATGMMNLSSTDSEALSCDLGKPHKGLLAFGDHPWQTTEPNGTVEIVSPNEGQTVVAGESVTISVEGAGDTNEAVVFAFFGSESWSDIVDLPWQENVNISPNSVGLTAMIMVIGLDSNRDITDWDDVNLVLDTNVVLEDIFFGLGDTWYFDFKSLPEQSHQFQLYPLGRFSNGSEHPLSLLGQIDYASSNETVATVDPNGLITVHLRGTSEITVTNSDVNTVLVVEVYTYLGDINLNGKVEFADFAVLANQWLRPPGYPPADIAPESGDNIVDVNDLKALTDHWLEGTVP